MRFVENLLSAVVFIVAGRMTLLYSDLRHEPPKGFRRLTTFEAQHRMREWFPLEWWNEYFVRNKLIDLYEIVTGYCDSYEHVTSDELLEWAQHAVEDGKVAAYVEEDGIAEFVAPPAPLAAALPPAMAALPAVAAPTPPAAPSVKASADTSADVPFFLQPLAKGVLEPGAERGDPVVLQEYPATPPPDWPAIPPAKTATFSEPPVPIELPAGTPVYRVVGVHPKYGTNDYRGEWWSLEPLPPTEAAWRRDYAVLGSWNGDGGYVRHVLEQPLKCWEGVTGPQDAQGTGYILRGGKKQIWVPAGSIDPLADGKTKKQVTLRTPWNQSKP